MPYFLLLLLGGLTVIVKGGDWFVAAAVRLARLLRVPRIVVGSTLVSLATTMPELVVSIVASARGEPGLAVGNAIGSCICNIGLILGVTAALREVTLHPAVLRVPIGVMLGVALLLFAFTRDLRMGAGAGWMLIATGAGYFVWDFFRHFRKRPPADEAREVAEIVHSGTRRFAWLHTTGGTVAQFIGSALLVVVGSRLLVDGAVGVASALSVPPLVIGLTVVAFGTSLPELITAISSSRQAAGDLSVGNVLGANIANLTFIVGTAAVLSEVRLDRATQLFHFPVMLVAMALLLWKLARDRRLGRADGFILLAGYAAYLAVVVVMAARG